MEKKLKRVNTDMLAKLVRINPNTPKNATWEDAWEIMATEYNIEGDVVTVRNNTSFTVSRNGEDLFDIVWPDVFDEKTGTYDWSRMYKEVIEKASSLKLFLKKYRVKK